MENIHMIDIEKRKQQFKERLESCAAIDFDYINREFKKLIDFEEGINACFSHDTRNKITLGFYLQEIKNSGLYNVLGYNSFEEYCDKEIGISKKYAYRLIKIFEFTKSRDVATLNCSEFTISQLQEMLSLSDDQLKQVNPAMTIKQIRDLKNTPKTIDELKQELQEEKEEYKPTMKDFNVENPNYNFDFFTKFGRSDLSYIAWQLYSELNRLRGSKAKKKVEDV